MTGRLQCPAYAPTTSIQCVMEEGHEPLGNGPDGVPLLHNFGGLGPYTPSVPDLAAAQRAEPRVQRWACDGVVLNANDKGEVSLAELKEFVACVERLDRSAQDTIRVHECGLRATRVAGEGGPHLDWRD